MKLKLILYTCLLIGLVSCSLEKSYISPLGNMLVSPNVTPQSFSSTNVQNKTEIVAQSAELTNTISSFPKTSNKEVNNEVSVLKKQVKNYVYALQEHNIRAKEKAFFEIESSYKKIQRLRKKLNPEENQVVNRYLVKIKGNITKLESLNKTDSTSIKQ